METATEHDFQALEILSIPLLALEMAGAFLAAILVVVWMWRKIKGEIFGKPWGR